MWQHLMILLEFSLATPDDIVGNVTVIVHIVIDLSSSDEFSVATPDETAGKESEFSIDLVSLRNII